MSFDKEAVQTQVDAAKWRQRYESVCDERLSLMIERDIAHAALARIGESEAQCRRMRAQRLITPAEAHDVLSEAILINVREATS